MTRHQYGIFAAVPQTSFPGDWPVVTLRNVRCFLRLLSSAMKWNSLERQVFIFLSVDQPGGISYFGHCAHLNSLISGYFYIWHCSARYLYKSKFQCNQYVNSATIKPSENNKTWKSESFWTLKNGCALFAIWSKQRTQTDLDIWHSLVEEYTQVYSVHYKILYTVNQITVVAYSALP